MSIEALFLSMEGRHVVTLDIPGAFMQADMDKLLHLRLDGEIASLLMKLDPTYEQFVTMEKGKPVIYTELSKALYGTLQAAMLFWKNLSSFLTDELGFEVNKQVKGQQCTIAWHVDDLKISCVDQTVIENIISKLEERYGKEAPLTVTRGKIHDYLGMNIDYSQKGKVIFCMKEFVEQIIKGAPEELLGGPRATPAANHLFDMDDGTAKLDQERKEIFHHFVAKLLYLCKRTQPDVLLPCHSCALEFKSQTGTIGRSWEGA